MSVANAGAVASAKKLQGVIKFFNAEKGFGFIKPNDGGKDVFVHAREVRQSGIDGDLDEGDIVEYVAETTDRGQRAKQIVRL